LLCLLALAVSVLWSSSAELAQPELAQTRRLHQTHDKVVDEARAADEHEHEGAEHEGAEHEGAEHGGHGHEGHGHKGHTHAVSSAMLTTSWLLIGFLVSNFILLRLVNYDDANVRSYTWKMLSSTVSIYLAVVLDGTISNCIMSLMRASLGIEEPESGCDWPKALVATVLCFLWFALVNTACYKLRHPQHTKYRFAASEIGGHITAFAGITALEASLAALSDTMMWVVAITIFVALMLVRCITDKVRRRFEERGASAVRSTDRQLSENSGKEEEKDWAGSACDAEDEASCIVSSFVVQELFIKTLFSGKAEEGMQKLSDSEVAWLSGAVCTCFLGVIVTTYLIKFHERVRNAGATGKSSESPVLERWVNNVRSTTAMSTSWLLLRLCSATAVRLFNNFDTHFLEVISAFLLTALAILAIILLDQLADKIQEQGDGSNAHTESARVVQETTWQKMSSWLRAPQPPPPQEQGLPPDSALNSAASDIAASAVELGNTAVKNFMETQNLEKAIRSIISSFALAVGLAWEHAFHAATHTVIETVPVDFLKDNKLISRTGVAALSFILMLPVWLKHIAPKAELHVTQFQQLMDKEKKVMENEG